MVGPITSSVPTNDRRRCSAIFSGLTARLTSGWARRGVLTWSITVRSETLTRILSGPPTLPITLTHLVETIGAAAAAPIFGLHIWLYTFFVIERRGPPHTHSSVRRSPDMPRD
jgi:hypothetical protein